MDIQIRAIKTISAIGAVDFAILLNHLTAAAIADPDSLFNPLDRLE